MQRLRRAVLARARNQLLFRALDDEEWVLWLDVDVIEYPADILQQLLALRLDIVHPHCVKQQGGPTFDLNGWRDDGTKTLQDFRGHGPVRLDAVGGTMLLVGSRSPPRRADLPCLSLRRREPAHPLAPSGVGSGARIETEGFGAMALDMGAQCWGLPDLEIIHAES